jgi:PilZ domain-containing protein
VYDQERKHKRLPLLIDVLWEGAAGKYEARTSDISLGGCFIDTIGQVGVGEKVNFKLCLANGEWIELQGQVMYALERMGFGVEFINLSDENQKRIEELVNVGE